MAKVKIDLRDKLKAAGCDCPVLKAATVETSDREFPAKFERHMFDAKTHAKWCKFRR